MYGLVSFANNDSALKTWAVLSFCAQEVMELIRNTCETMKKSLYILCSSRSSFVVMEAIMVVSDGFVSWAPATPRHLLCSRHLPWKSCLPPISKAIIIFSLSLGTWVLYALYIIILNVFISLFQHKIFHKVWENPKSLMGLVGASGIGCFGLSLLIPSPSRRMTLCRFFRSLITQRANPTK